MLTVLSKRGLVAGAAAAMIVAGVLTVGAHGAVTAGATQTSPVSAGPSRFTQAIPTGAPSDYSSQLERCATGTNHPISGANPVLSQPLTTSFTSNVPLSVYTTFNGNQYYGDWQFVFTNTGSQPLGVDCALMIFHAPSGSDDHSYAASQTYGHPQEDYLEVPRGDGTSFYIVRLGFHDVTYSERVINPGQTFTYTIGGIPSSAINLEQMRDSMSFTADLNLDANLAAIENYGTNRLTN